MNLRRIKHTLLRLSPEEKVIGIGSIAIACSVFMPWYQITMNFDGSNEITNGLGGDLGVIGFVIFLMSLMSLVSLVGENMHLPLPQFGYKREQIVFFFLGQSAFLSLLTMAVYTKRSLEFTEAGLRFGMWTALLGSFFGAMAAFALLQKTRKGDVVEYFEDDRDEVEPETVEEMIEEQHKTAEAVDTMAEEAVSFAEDITIMEEASEAIADQNDVTDYIPEDDMIEDIQEVKAYTDEQKSRIMREAGIGGGRNPESKKSPLSSDFYRDN